jgi:intraflagellar transport protein 172
MWDEALNLAEAKGHSNLEDLKEAHSRWLLETGQEEKAGALREQDGEILEALNLYLRGGLATRASRLVQSNAQLISNPDVVSRVTEALTRGEFFEQAGELYERVGDEDQV